MSRFFSNLPALMAVRGVFAILFGIVALVWPGITLVALVALFGAFAIVDGITAIIGAIAHAHSPIPRWALALEGVAGIAAGAITFIYPGITSLALLYIVAAWALITGALLIGAAVAGPRFEPAWLMVIDGAISLIFGVAIIASPGSGILAIVWTLGLYAIFGGVWLLVTAYRLHTGAAKLESGVRDRVFGHHAA